MQHYKQLFYSVVVVVVFLLLMQHTQFLLDINIFLITGIVDIKKFDEKIIRILATGFLFHKFLILSCKITWRRLETRGGDTIAENFVFLHIIEKNK